MKKNQLLSAAFSHDLIERLFAIPKHLKILPLACVLATFMFGVLPVSSVKAQTVTFDAFNTGAYDAVLKGYVQAGVGTYFRGTNPGTITIGQGNPCNTDPSSGTTGSSIFIFLPTISNISKIVVNGTGTGSNRTFQELSTSTTLAGTYTVDAGAVGTGSINSGTCGSIEIVPSAPISSGTYMRFRFSGNLNITSIVFTNNAATPTVTTVSVTPGYTTAAVSGSLDSDGGFSGVTRGFVYSATNPSPTLLDNLGVITDPAQVVGSYTADITSLTPGTTYYVAAYATNTLGTSYGAPLTFVTKTPTTPTLTTVPLSNTTSFGVNTGGTITDDGGSPITAKGVVWSTSPNPTIPSVNSTTDGAGSSSFPSIVTGLTASTQYYIRAYATNGTGTAYGDELTFTTDVPQPTLLASVTSLPFSATAIGNSSVLTYTLTGSNLTPDGTITITAPTGFTVSPATFTYSGTSFTQVVTVTFTPSQFTSYSGAITQSGGGATGAYNVSPTVSGAGKLPTPPVTSNVGNDFWLGFGYHTAMDQKDGDEANLSVYVSSVDKDATVVVEMPGLGGGFTTQEVFIPKGTVQEISGFPRGDNDKFNPTNQPDSRLYYTGVSNRAIHVYSKDGTPVSAWLYTYSSDNSAAGSMIFPTNTWNTSYSVQAYGNTTNSGIPNSFFFVIAENDNTEIEFVPSVDILDSAAGNLLTSTPTGAIKYLAGQTYRVTLNRGQVFNAMSSFVSKSGLDLSGTTVKSLDCSKKIAVFGGNGRVLVDVNIPQQTSSRSGSDNLIQQMFPKVAWGTKYYTTPTKHMEYNLFRINVDDATTIVKANGIPLAGLVNGYYEYQTNVPSLIEADKPISVTQFIAAQAYATGKVSLGLPSEYGMNGIGDPEMIILSPAQQAITKATVYSPSFKNNKTPAGAYINVVIPKTGLNSFKLDAATNLTQMVDTGSSSFEGIPLDPAPALIPVKDAFKPYAADPDYYFARFKVEYPAAHSLEATVPFNAIAYGTDDGESYGFNAGTQLNDLTTPLIIKNPYGGPTQKLTTCRGTDFQFSAVLPYQTNKITFSFGNTPITPNTDTTISVSQGNIPFDSTFTVNGVNFYVYKLSTKYNFTQTGDYSVNVTSFNENATDGCGSGSDKTITYTINVVAGVTADFDIAYNSCINDSVILTDKSNGQGYDITKWNWSYNNGATPLISPDDTVQNPRIKNAANNTAANYTLLAVNNIGCFNTTTKALPVSQKPTVTLPDLAAVCANVAAYQLPAGSPAGGTYKGDGVTAGGLFNPAQAGVGTHTIKYVFTAESGCGDSTTKDIVVSPTTTLSINPVEPLCITDEPVTLVGNPAEGTFSTNGPGLNGNVFSPSAAGIGPHTITYSFGGNCAAPVTTTITVNNVPAVDAGPNLSTTTRTPVTLKATASQGATYLWSAADGVSGTISNPAILNPAVTRGQRGEYVYILTASVGGCEATDRMTVKVEGNCIDAPPAFTPNGDGTYDYWVIYNPECVRQLKLDIFNRWGSRVYHADNYDNKWEGKWSGKLLPDGTYYYVIIAALRDGQEQRITGNVTIIR